MQQPNAVQVENGNNESADLRKKLKADDEEEERNTAQYRERGFATAPSPNALRTRERSRMNRLVAEEALKFVGELLRGAVTARWFFLQTLQANGFEIARNTRIEEPG